MKKLTVLIISIILISLFSCNSKVQAGEADISGSVESGLRILPIDSGNGDLNYTVYRGDYIVFDLPDSGRYEFTVSDLEISETLPKPETEKPYVKMKKSGEYSFTLGNRTGTIKVIELEEPNYTELTAAEASELMANTDPLIIDVRTEGEYAISRIEGAKLLPVQLISGNLDKLQQFKDEDILLYCQSGNRSTVAARIMLDGGFTNIYNLRYGIGDWASKGFPVEK